MSEQWVVVMLVVLTLGFWAGAKFADWSWRHKISEKALDGRRLASDGRLYRIWIDQSFRKEECFGQLVTSDPDYARCVFCKHPVQVDDEGRQIGTWLQQAVYAGTSEEGSIAKRPGGKFVYACRTCCEPHDGQPRC